MSQKKLPDKAFAYINGDSRLLRHHTADVKDGNDHETVDPDLLHLALEALDYFPIEKEKKAQIRRHLLEHKDALASMSKEEDQKEDRSESDARKPSYPLHNFKCSLTYANEVRQDAGTVEGPPSRGWGKAHLIYNDITRELYYHIMYEDLSSEELPGHIHLGYSDEDGPVTLPLPMGRLKMGSAILTEEQEKQLFEGVLYINIHSQKFPEGEIRGQILPVEIVKCDLEEKTQDAQANLDDPNNADLKLELNILNTPEKLKKFGQPSMEEQRNRDRSIPMPDFEMVNKKTVILDPVHASIEEKLKAYVSKELKSNSNILDIKNEGMTKLYSVTLGEDKDRPEMSLYFEVGYDGGGEVRSVYMLDSYIPASMIGDVIEFLNNIPK